MIVLDIETLGIDGLATEPVTAPSNYTDPVKIADYIAKGEQLQREKAALYPWSCRIIALGYCDTDSEIPEVRVFDTEDAERAILRRFWDAARGQRFLSFNGRTFDLPVLMARSKLLGVKHPEVNLSRWRNPNVDLLDVLTFDGSIASRSLKWFAQRFGLPMDDAFSGKEIAGLFEDKNWDAIAAHCAWDVTTTKNIGRIVGVC